MTIEDAGAGNAATPPVRDTRLDRLVANWVYGGAMIGVLLLALLPAVGVGWTTAQLLVALTLPVYMIHQYEEHDADRFRAFVNARIAGGREALTRLDVFIINVFGVWVALAVVIAIAFRGDPGFGVTAGYFLLVNGLLHAAQGLALRVYNPGLATGVVLFLPLGAAVLLVLRDVADAGDHALGFAIVAVLHAVIVARVVVAARRWNARS